MAILTVINTEILCLSCDRRVLTKWKSYMVCTHIVGVWKFLRIGTGADPVKAAFCIICPYCLERKATRTARTTFGDDDIEEIRCKASSKLFRDTMNDIEKENDIVITTTYKMVEAYLAKARPLIEVGKKVQTSVQAPGWNDDCHLADRRGRYGANVLH